MFKALDQGQSSGSLTHMGADRAASAPPPWWTQCDGAITVLLAVTVKEHLAAGQSSDCAPNSPTLSGADDAANSQVLTPAMLTC